MSNIVFHAVNDGCACPDMLVERQTVWLMQPEITELFQVAKRKCIASLRKIELRGNYQGFHASSRHLISAKGSRIFREHLTKILVMNDELLAYTGEIRVSDKRFYQKALNLFVLSSNYQTCESM